MVQSEESGQGLLGSARLARFVGHYVVANFQAALEYRVSFWTQVAAMAINDAMWIAFWGLFFSRFTVVRDYQFIDVVTIWALAAFSFGIATGIFGNAHRFSSVIAEGGLDFYLVLPKPVLLHLLVSAMSWAAWGDVLFGFGVYLVFVHPTPAMVAEFLLLSVFSTAIFVSYFVAANSLAFWLGNAEGFASQLFQALLLFSTYPDALFTGLVKVLLYTVVPAGFVVYLPVRLLHAWDWPLALGLAAFAVANVIASTAIFYAGLRRYESGNLLAMRS